MLPANQDVVLDQVNGNAMEIVAEIDCKDAPMVEMNVLRSLNEEAVTVSYTHLTLPTSDLV